MPNSEINLSSILASPDVDVALTITASIFGLPTATVIRIVESALPKMVKMAAANPELRKRIDAACGVALPIPVAEFYALMASSLEVRQSAMDDYRAAYGNMLDSVNRAAARQAGVTEGQAREVVAALLPALGRFLVQPDW
jgi:hypothetical protein